MPSGITHQLIAEEALKEFPAAAAAAVERAPDEYYLGCQGPDVFFFYRIGNRSEYNLGKFMHRNRVYELFGLFLAALRGEEGAPKFDEAARTRVLSYALGYIAHYSADSTFHPFVYRYLKEKDCEKREHQQIENDWDVYFLREYRGRSAEKFTFSFSYRELKKDGTLARLYAYLADKLGREEVPRGKFFRGVKNFCRYLKFFHGKCYRSQRRWRKAEKIFHAKRFLSRLYPRETPAPEYLSGEHFLPFSEGRGKNADDLFSRAVDETVRLVRLFSEAIEGAPLNREDFGRGLLTGQPID